MEFAGGARLLLTVVVISRRLRSLVERKDSPLHTMAWPVFVDCRIDSRPDWAHWALAEFCGFRSAFGAIASLIRNRDFANPNRSLGQIEIHERQADTRGGPLGTESSHLRTAACDCTCDPWAMQGYVGRLDHRSVSVEFPRLSHRINVLTPIG